MQKLTTTLNQIYGRLFVAGIRKQTNTRSLIPMDYSEGLLSCFYAKSMIAPSLAFLFSSFCRKKVGQLGHLCCISILNFAPLITIYSS